MVVCVALYISVNLAFPIGSIRFGHSRARASMPVPKTTVDKNRSLRSLEDEIGTPRKVFVMKAITKTHGMNLSSNIHLR